LTRVVQVAPIARQLPAPVMRRGLWWQLAVLAILIGGLYFSILLRLAAQWWHDPNFSHGFLVPLFSLFVLWKERSRLVRECPSPSWWGLPILLFAILVLLAGVLGSELFLARTSLLLLIAGLIVFFLGWRYFQLVLFPWVFLFLMIPIPAIVFNQITFPLQILASKIAAWLLPLAGVPVFREGNIIHLPTMPLEVAEACSGIRSLLSLTTLAIIYGYVRETGTLRRVVLTVASVPIAILANSFRIFGTGVLVQYWSADKAEGFFHSLSGMFIFLFSLALLVGFHHTLRLFDRQVSR
jgi:exosortase